MPKTADQAWWDNYYRQQQAEMDRRRRIELRDSPYRIYMDPVGDLRGGWFGGDGIYVNEPIYCRVPKKAKAWTWSKDQAINRIREMRDLGYPCHAVPSITKTEKF
jgi:hypothetical protein